MQKLIPDAAIHAHAFGDLLHICANALTQGGNFIDKSDLGGQKRIGRIFNHLGTFQICGQDWEVAQELGA